VIRIAIEKLQSNSPSVSSSKSPSGFDGYVWEDFCYFNIFGDMDGNCGTRGCDGFPDMNGAAMCIDDYDKNITLSEFDIEIDINIVKALDCSKSVWSVL
jgi:hypothetical protein